MGAGKPLTGTRRRLSPSSSSRSSLKLCRRRLRGVEIAASDIYLQECQRPHHLQVYNNLIVSPCSKNRESQRLDFPPMLRRPLPCEYFRDFPGTPRTQPCLGHPDDRDGNTDATAGPPIARLDGTGIAACFVEGWVLVTVRASPTQEHYFEYRVAINPTHGDHLWESCNSLTLVCCICCVGVGP